MIRMDPAVAGPLFMLSAALLFTLLNLLIKLLCEEYSVWQIGFYRFFGGMLVLLAFFGRRGNPFRGNNRRLLVLRGCVGSIAFLSLITAVRLLPLSTAMVIFYSFPAFSAGFSFWMYGDRIRKSELACIFCVLVGVGVLFDFRMDGGFFGKSMALMGAMFAGLTVTLIRTLRENNGPVVIYLYFCAMGALVTIPPFVLHPIFPKVPLEGLMLAGIILCSVLAQLLMNQGFFYCTGWEGGVLMSSEVVFTTAVGIFFLGDPVSARFWAGGLLVVGSVIAMNRVKANQKRKAGDIPASTTPLKPQSPQIIRRKP